MKAGEKRLNSGLRESRQTFLSGLQSAWNESCETGSPRSMPETRRDSKALQIGWRLGVEAPARPPQAWRKRTLKLRLQVPGSRCQAPCW